MAKKEKIEIYGTLEKNITGNDLQQKMYLLANYLGYHIKKTKTKCKIKKGEGGKKFELEKDTTKHAKQRPDVLSIDIDFHKNNENQECFTFKIKGEDLKKLEIKSAVSILREFKIKQK